MDENITTDIHNRKPMTAGRRALLGFLIFSLAMLLVLILAEIGLRFAYPQRVSPVLFEIDPILGVVRAANAAGTDSWPGIYEYSFTTNSLGMRGSQEYAVGKSEKKRLLILGDSFVFGVGVDNDKNFVALLQAKLDQAFPEQWEVINGGQPGKGTDFALRFFDVTAAKWQPDYVLYATNWTDIIDDNLGVYYDISNPDAFEVRDVIADLPPRTITALKYKWAYSWAMEHLHLTGLITAVLRNKFLIAGRKEKRDPSARENRKDTKVETSPTPVETPALPKAKNRKPRLLVQPRGNYPEHLIKPTTVYLAALQKRVAEAGGQLALFYVPVKVDVQRYIGKQELGQYETDLGPITDNMNILFFSPTEQIAADPRCCKALYFDEGVFWSHWTDRAHQIAADEIFLKIVEQDL